LARKLRPRDQNFSYPWRLSEVILYFRPTSTPADFKAATRPKAINSSAHFCAFIRRNYLAAAISYITGAPLPYLPFTNSYLQLVQDISVQLKTI
jgi:hypothetical protein